MIDQPISFMVCLSFLSSATYFDLKTRTVPNELWGMFFVVSLPIVIYNIVILNAVLFQTVIAMIVMYIVMYGLFHLKVFGGADAKALLGLTFIYSSPTIPIMVLLIATTLTIIPFAAYYLLHRSLTLSDLNHIPIPFFVPLTAGYLILMVFL